MKKAIKWQRVFSDKSSNSEKEWCPVTFCLWPCFLYNGQRDLFLQFFSFLNLLTSFLPPRLMFITFWQQPANQYLQFHQIFFYVILLFQGEPIYIILSSNPHNSFSLNQFKTLMCLYSIVMGKIKHSFPPWWDLKFMLCYVRILQVILCCPRILIFLCPSIAGYNCQKMVLYKNFRMILDLGVWGL